MFDRYSFELHHLDAADQLRVRQDDDLTTRKLTYERMVAERERIRGARAFFARQLGPLPAAAGVSLALVGAFSEKNKHQGWVIAALALFALMVLVSILYSRMPAYRDLRDYRVRKQGMEEGDGDMQPAAWYDVESKLECSIYSSQPDKVNFSWLPWRNLPGNLQQQLDKERQGVFIVQALFLLLIVCLVFARITW
jgi:Na+/melibiose symporter-like transporter